MQASADTADVAKDRYKMFQTTKRNITRKYKILGTVIKVNGRTIGQVIGDTLVKDVSSKKHFLHYPEEAIAFTIDALHAAQRAGAEYVDVLDTESGTHYRTAIANYFEHGEAFNYGWGEQIKLALPNFAQVRDPEYMASTDTDAQEYTGETSTHDGEPESNVQPLNIKSHARTGAHYTKGKQTPKQLRMFGNGGHYG